MNEAVELAIMAELRAYTQAVQHMADQLGMCDDVAPPIVPIPPDRIRSRRSPRPTMYAGGNGRGRPAPDRHAQYLGRRTGTR